MIEAQLKQVVIQKAKGMLGSKEWVEYGEAFAREVGIEKAFLAGALDAMAFDVAAVVNPRRLPSHNERKELIDEILKGFTRI
ncbi:MAG: hypothetical protein DDT24_00463 [Chloroflexi bacterium]|nr:hypothetical protein [Chloroflexota bacterium]MBT9166053.1 hypothetical protein [Chloroflexota bacterium]